MCGIAGYVGDRESADVLVDALSKLEYRGYDSAGIAVFDHGNIKVKKCKGRLANLVEKMDEEGKPETGDDTRQRHIDAGTGAHTDIPQVECGAVGTYHRQGCQQDVRVLGGVQQRSGKGEEICFGGNTRFGHNVIVRTR